MLKLKEYEKYHGYYDGFYMQKVKYGKNITTDNEWNLIKMLTEDIRLIQRGLAAKQFAEKVNARKRAVCDNDETVTYLDLIALKGW